MSVSLQIASQLRLAKDDVEAARLLLTAVNRNAVYHLEQAAEKIILAILTSEGKHGGIAHHLKEMVDLIPDVNPLKQQLRKVEHLAAYATTFRYPTPGGRIKAPPPQVEVSADAKKVEDLLSDAAARFKVELSKPDSPAGSQGPLR